MNTSIAIIVILALIMGTQAHLCIFEPHQRGDLDISGPSRTCYRPDGVCGGQAVEAPVVTYTAGSKVQIRFQQNLNHYSVGYPGYFEIAYAPKVTENQADFQNIDYIRDVYMHRELIQTNFTYEFSVPAEPTAHGIVQMRYISHKPGEPIFHQCFDVKIVAAQKKAAVKQVNHKAGTPTLYALRYNPNKKAVTELVKLNKVTKEFDVEYEFPAIVATSVASNAKLYGPVARANHELMKNNVNLAFIEDVSTFNPNSGDLMFMVSTDPADPDHLPTRYITYNLNSKKMGVFSLDDHLAEIEKIHGESLQISSFIYNAKNGEFLLFGLLPSGKGYQWVLYAVGQNGPQLIAKGPEEEMYFINYLWSSVDQVKQQYSVLLRDEHDPFNSTQTLYTVDLNTKNTFAAKTKVSESFSCFHNTEVDGAELLGLSVGSPENYLPHPKVVDNRIITLNSHTAKEASAVSLPKHLNGLPWQGGCVKGGFNPDSGALFHKFRLNNKDSYALVQINTKNNNNLDFFSTSNDLPFLYNPVVVNE